MCRQQFARSAFAFALVVNLMACGDAVSEPRVGLENVTAYASMTGTVEIKVDAAMASGVKRVELYVGAIQEPVAVAKKAPYVLTWDTTTVADGVYKLAVRAVSNDDELAGSQVTSVVVLNQGVVADVFDYQADAGYVVEIPAGYDGTQEVDVPHHWFTPAGVKTIVAVAGWIMQPNQEPWNLGLSVGKGICPHRGKQYGDEVYSNESPVVLTVNTADVDDSWTEFPPTTDENDPLTQWYFVHIRPAEDTREPHVGQAVPYWLKVFLLQ